jgi:hypothetical protein
MLGNNCAANICGQYALHKMAFRTRVATASAFAAATCASFPGAQGMKSDTRALCCARSQLGYVAGDTGFSYVVGFGDKYPLQARVHLRNSESAIEDVLAILAGSALIGSGRPHDCSK